MGKGTKRLGSRLRGSALSLAACATVSLASIPSVAFADPDASIDAQGMLEWALNAGGVAVIVVGGALAAWGVAKLGMAVKDQQGGNAMSEAIATIAGGAIVIVAGVFFRSISDQVSLN